MTNCRSDILKETWNILNTGASGMDILSKRKVDTSGRDILYLIKCNQEVMGPMI